MPSKSDAEVEAELDKLKIPPLDALVDDLLIEQRATDLGIDVEAEVRQQFVRIANESNLGGVDALEVAMRQQGIDPEEARSALRKRFQKEHVLQSEVLQASGLRGATTEQLEVARKQYLKKLRDEAFIKITLDTAATAP